jgi:hypothetical protein
MTDFRLVDFDLENSDKSERKKLVATPYVWRDPATIPKRSWIYGKHYIRKFVSATIAPGGLAKTSLILVEATAMALKCPFLRIIPTEQVRVWIWNGEDPKEEIERRIAAICQYYEIDGRKLAEHLFLDSGRTDPIKLAAATKGAIKIDADLEKDIIGTIRDNGIGVAMFDPFISTHSVPESDNTNMDAVAKCFAGIADETNSSIELPHHIRKPSGGQHEITVDDARGASAVVNAARPVRVLNRMTKQQAEELRISDPRFYFRADTGKTNLAPPEVATWHRIINVDLPNGDAVGVVAPWDYPAPMDRITVAHMYKIREVAAQGTWRKDTRSDDWIGNAVAKIANLNPSDTADRKTIKAALAAWFTNGVLAVQIREDEHRKEREYVIPGNWNEA